MQLRSLNTCSIHQLSPVGSTICFRLDYFKQKSNNRTGYVKESRQCSHCSWLRPCCCYSSHRQARVCGGTEFVWQLIVLATDSVFPPKPVMQVRVQVCWPNPSHWARPQIPHGFDRVWQVGLPSSVYKLKKWQYHLLSRTCRLFISIRFNSMVAMPVLGCVQWGWNHTSAFSSSLEQALRYSNIHRL